MYGTWHCSPTDLGVWALTGVSEVLASIRFSAEVAQHYNFAVCTHLLNAYCVLRPELEIIKRRRGKRNAYAFDPTGRKTYINGAAGILPSTVGFFHEC